MAKPQKTLTVWSGVRKLARLMRQGRVPDERQHTISQAMESAARRAAKYRKPR